jgi:hypothetical protein
MLRKLFVVSLGAPWQTLGFAIGTTFSVTSAQQGQYVWTAFFVLGLVHAIIKLAEASSAYDQFMRERKL